MAEPYASGSSVYALRQLLQALGPIVGAELEHGKAVKADWASGLPKGKLGTWEAEAEDLGDELEAFIMETFIQEYKKLMRKVGGVDRTTRFADADDSGRRCSDWR